MAGAGEKSKRGLAMQTAHPIQPVRGLRRPFIGQQRDVPDQSMIAQRMGVQELPPVYGQKRKQVRVSLEQLIGHRRDERLRAELVKAKRRQVHHKAILERVAKVRASLEPE